MNTNSTKYNVIERFFSHTRKRKNGCLEWIGYRTPYGYGEIIINGKKIRAHRFSYELEKGKISTGKVLDHLCNNKSCVLVEHLEAVTIAENTRRAQEKTRKSHTCKNGHKLIGKNKNGNRWCKECMQIRNHVIRNCIICGSSYAASKWSLSDGFGLTCSKKCSIAAGLLVGNAKINLDSERVKVSNEYSKKSFRNQSQLKKLLYDIVQKTEITDIGYASSCWTWKGNTRPPISGYGRYKSKFIHRISYELFNDDLMCGLQINHLCKNKTCWRPNHLEQVTPHENTLYAYRNIEANMTFGRWTTMNRVRSKNGRIQHLCICICRTMKYVDAVKLRSGTSNGCRSCGARNRGVSLEK